MHPDWYRTPMAEDDPRMIGDYPDVPAESYQHRDPHDPTYTDPQNRRRFGEPVPEDYEVLTVWSFDHERTYSAKFILGGLAGFFGTMYLLYEGLRRVPNPLVPFGAPRDLPYAHASFPAGRVPETLANTSHKIV